MMDFPGVHKKMHTALLVFVVWGMVCVPVSGLTDVVKIHIAQTSSVTGDQLLLSDIARIQAKEFLEKAIGNIPLGNAPKPGQILQLKRNRLLRLIQSNHLINDSAQILCPEEVYVKRNAQTIDDEFIRAQVMTYLETRLSPRSVEIITMKTRGIKDFPEGNLELIPGPRFFMGKNGRFSLSMDVLVENIDRGNISVTGQIAEFESIVCAARDMERGTVITEEDLCLGKKNLVRLSNRGIKSKEKAIGQTLAHPVNKGQILDPEKLVPTSLVKKGEVVPLLVSKNNLRIVTAGICMEDGFANRPVQVENIRSGKKVRGILRENATVEVIY